MLVYDVKSGIGINTKTVNVFGVSGNDVGFVSGKVSQNIEFQSNEEAKGFVEDMLRAEAAGCAVYRVEAHASDPAN